MTANIDQLIASYSEITSVELKSREKLEQAFFTYFGDLSQDFIASVAQTIEQELLSNDIHASLVKRTFSVLVEGLQNARKHGLKSSSGAAFGHIICTNKAGTGIRISIGNYVTNQQQEKLSAFLSTFQNKNIDEIKSNYLASLKAIQKNQEEGIGLGLILIMLKSNGNFEFEFLSLSQNILYFNLVLNILPQSTDTTN